VPIVSVKVEVPLFRVLKILTDNRSKKQGTGQSIIAKGENVVRVLLSKVGSVMFEKDASFEKDMSVEQEGPFTSLIVDTTGLDVRRSMSPKIRREDGSEVWGTVDADKDYVLDAGVVVYAKSMSDAMKNSRAGENPLIVTAVGRAGGKFYCDAVVTDDDSRLILKENGISHFCDEYKVIFLVD
jgi:transcriptional regulator of met regulon